MDAVQIIQASSNAQSRLTLAGAMVFQAGGPVAAPGADGLLLESGDDLLLESGDRLLLE
jgi:hypothetical protein